MKKPLAAAILLFSFMMTLCSITSPGRADANEYGVNVDASSHQKFGLYYPATYKFKIPPGAQGLVAQYSYSSPGEWKNLPEKTSSDIFNGIDAARFDYAAGFAYLSVRFSRTSDNIYLRVVDSASQPVEITFDSITPLYDSRKTAVTVTLDDWFDWANDSFMAASDFLAADGLYFSVGLMTASVPWSSVQQKIDQHGDFMEVASHSGKHSCSAAQYTANGYEAEIIGSRDLIRKNLTFSASPYVPLYIEPCSYSDDTVKRVVTAADYLVTRSGVPFQTGFVEWDPTQGRYGRAGITFDDFNSADDINLLNTANAAFDKVASTGGIYHLMDHPWKGHWKSGSFLLQHLDHIKGKSDVWYVPFGQLYEYHFVQEMRGNLKVTAVTAGVQSQSGTYSMADVLRALQVAKDKLPLSEADKRLDVAPLGSDGKSQPDGVIDMGDVTELLKRAEKKGS